MVGFLPKSYTNGGMNFDRVPDKTTPKFSGLPIKSYISPPLSWTSSGGLISLRFRDVTNSLMQVVQADGSLSKTQTPTHIIAPKAHLHSSAKDGLGVPGFSYVRGNADFGIFENI